MNDYQRQLNKKAEAFNRLASNKALLSILDAVRNDKHLDKPALCQAALERIERILTSEFNKGG